MGMLDKNIIQTATIERLVDVYNQAKARLIEAQALLTDLNALILSVGHGSGGNWAEYNISSSSRYDSRFNALDVLLADLKRNFWRDILHRLNFRPYVTADRWEQINKDIDAGNSPEPSLEAAFELLEAVSQNLGKEIRAKVAEAYKILTSGHERLKTNRKSNQAALGAKVVIRFAYPDGGTYPTPHGMETKLKSVEDAFYLLDGQKPPDGWASEIYSAIMHLCYHGGANSGKTKYFEWTYYKNGNLHLTFTRPDLVKAMILTVREQKLKE